MAVVGNPVQLIEVRPSLTQLTIGPVAVVQARLLQVGVCANAAVTKATASKASDASIDCEYKLV